MAPQAKQLGYGSGSNANGTWRRAIDGMLRQAGEVSLVNGVAAIVFPVSFATQVDFVGMTPVLNSTAITDCSVYQTAEATLAGVLIGGSVLTIGVGAAITAGTFKVRWWAVGS